jgi:1-acyl-sn-glycerol-3-phosphate acyltransferase
MSSEESPGAAPAAVEALVLDTVRELAAELGGARAAGAAAPAASLEREVGFGSLERVELLSRLERRVGRPLGDALLTLDTPGELARAIAGAPAAAALAGQTAAAHAERAPPLAAAEPLRAGAPTIHAALWERARRDPERPHAFLREDDGAEHVITYGRLLAEARAVAGGLRERGVARGDAVALMLPTSLDFLRSFQAILMAGAVPVPIYPPVRLDRLEEYALRQAAILRDAGVTLMITVPRARPVAALLRASVPTLREVTSAGELAAAGALWPAPEGEGGDAAFIQYTSGSTGHPKGVLLTHDNLLANIRAIAAGVDARPTDVGASWLPLYHDMGLIGTWLWCLVQGLPLDLQSPLSFLARPERWLWAIHRRRATLSAAPNFAYELCVRRIPDEALEGLDLSSWRCALNGAEPVSPETLERFAARFAPYGFRREALMPVYGLAENSVALCVPPPGRGPRVDRVERAAFERERRATSARPDDTGALRFVSVGRVLPEHDLLIVDAEGRELPERRVGRLIFRGPSMTPGYFRKPEATRAMSVAGGFYDSGDLAYTAEGEVYITGRGKDLIIKGGRNLVPQEIEELAAQVEGVRKGCVVALGVPHEAQGTELLVVVAETRAGDEPTRARIQSDVIEKVAEAVGAPPDVVALVPPGAVPKTSSGKIRRAATKELYLRGELGRPPRTPLRTKLRLLGAAAGQALAPPARAVLRGLYAAWVALALLPVVLVAWPLVAFVPSRRLAAWISRHGSLYALRAMGCSLGLEGDARLRGGGPYLLAANHTSYFDMPALMALLPMDLTFVAKKEILRWPFAGAFARRARHIMVDRADALDGVSAATQVTAAVRAGRSVLVFPEATFTAAAGLRPFRLGVFKAAVEAGLPVTPVALRGVRRVLREGTWVPRPGPIVVWVGEPIAPQGSDWRAVVDLRDRVADALAAHCGEPRLDLIAAGPEPRP